MKRPVIGTISILALLSGGLYLGWHYKDKSSEPTRTSYEGAAARSAIQAWLELPLPTSAFDVHCCLEDVEQTKLVFARFDIPSIELVSLFDPRSRFPTRSDLKPDPALRDAMTALAAPQRPWWQVEQLSTPLCAQKSGRRNMAPAVLKWRIQTCAADVSPSTTRVYIAFSEEPAAGQ